MTSDPKEALERLIAALRERPKGAPGYDDQASSIEHQAADVIDALIAKQEGLEREVERLRAVGCVPTNGALKELRDELSAEFEALPDGEYVNFSLGFLRRLAQHKCGSEGGLAYQTARAEAAESKFSALSDKAENVCIAHGMAWDMEGVIGELRALLDRAVPVEPAQRTETITRVHLPSDVASIPDAYVDVRSPVPPSQGAAPNVVHHHNIHPWAQPGDRPDRWWRLRFDDQDMREMIWSGPDAEREARAAYAQYSPAWNCYLFATVEARAQAHPDVAGLVEALRKIEASSMQGSWFWNVAHDALAAFQSRQDERS